MKKILTLTLLTALFSLSYSQPNLSGVTFPDSTDLFGLLEISFQMGHYPNPYDPEIIDTYAEFISPNGKLLKVNGFYYEGYSFENRKGNEVATANRKKGWRIRFTPEQVGRWTFTLHAIDSQGETVLPSTGTFHFECKSISSGQGFISIANRNFLKRDIVENGQRKQQSFFPSGPNIAWYEYDGSPTRPRGIYNYEEYIDSIAGSANFMRIWLNRYEYLNLYGPEFTQRADNQPAVYFNTTLNQKDAAELDHIVACAAQHGISLMPCIFTFGDFLENGTYKHDPNNWKDNPFHSILGLEQSTDFFTDSEAKHIAKNLIRYIVARWGYATNILCWEFWNETDNIPSWSLSINQFHRNIVSWHEEMALYTRSIDPFEHPLTTSTTFFSKTKYLSRNLFKPLDIVQWHTYGDIQQAKSKEQRAHQLFIKRNEALALYPDKPFFVGEFGFGQEGNEPRYEVKDPFGIDTHNSLWATLFSTEMGPASFWFWGYLEKRDLFRIYKPLLKYCQNLPLPLSSFTARHTAKTVRQSTVFPNGIQTYYMINATEDTLYGWCQDTAFSYQALRRLTDHAGQSKRFNENGVFDPKGYVYTLNPAKKPKPSSKSNTITLPIKKQPIGTQYIVRWFDGETGSEIAAEKTAVVVQQGSWGKRFISFEFPSSVRDLNQMKINNIFGDAAFIIVLDKGQNERSNAYGTAPENKLKIKVSRPD